MTKIKIDLETILLFIGIFMNFIIVVYFVSLNIPDYAFIYPSYIRHGIILMIFTIIIAIIFSTTFLITISMSRKRATKNTEIKYPDTASILAIIGSFTCIDGGIFLIWSSLNLMASYGFYLIPSSPITIVIIIGAIIGLKYPKGGNMICLILSLFLGLLLSGLIFYISSVGIGILLTIIGSIIGLIGVSIRGKKMDLHERTENIMLL